jgi:hypothetical protein
VDGRDSPSRRRERDQQISRSYGRCGDLADQIRLLPEVHQAHGERPCHEAGAALPGDEHAAGTEHGPSEFAEHMYLKLSVRSRVRATRKALSEGWTTPRDVTGP